VDLRRFFSRAEVNGSFIDLTDEEAYHLKKVLRVKKGKEIEITDGEGTLYFGLVDSFFENSVRVKIEKTRRFDKRKKNIIIAPSLLKRTSMNFMIEKLSEIGVDEITPVLFNRTELKISDKIVQKWEKIAITSLKVNKSVWLTKINSPLSLKDLIEKYKLINNKIMLDIDGNTKISDKTVLDTIAVIGPPGDYISAEKKLLIGSGYGAIKINSSILKVETAAISISAVLKERDFSMETS